MKTPFDGELAQQIAAAYGMVRASVSRQLEVCLCPMCMTEEARREIIATPMREMPAALIRDYSNSAHGVPRDLDDLAVFLPRYMELIAAQDEVDDVGVGAELLRFGDARRAGGFPAEALAQVYDRWARLVVLACGWAEAQGDEEAMLSPQYLFAMLPAGGVPAAVVTGALEALFALPDVGGTAMAQMLNGLGHAARRGRLDMFAMRYVPAKEREALAQWLGAWCLSPAVEELLSDPGFAPLLPLEFWRERAGIMRGLVTRRGGALSGDDLGPVER
ncbi:hypothetical protein N4R57_07830 [Rhodobacteraceae bacterium D3-12]|nr:hypothetical protein N4R57_07830 [Rhodobacteraceae bacterium D3-12]